MLIGVPSTEIDKVWEIAKPILFPAVERSEQDYSIDDIYAALKERDMQLWTWQERGKITACLVTMIVTYPRRRVCQLPYIAGRGLKDWLKYEPLITAWARERHCSRLEGFARDGWLRVLPHWRTCWTTIRKDI